MSVDVDSSYIIEDSNVEILEEVPYSINEIPLEFDSRMLLGNLSNLRFPLKLWRIVTDCTSGAIQWIYDGTAIAINYQIFEKEYLDASKRLFKTNNITSFVRQLNLYGFRKVPKNSKSGNAGLAVSFSNNSNNYSIFHHDSFRSDRPDLLLHVNRRGIKADGKKARVSSRARREPRRRVSSLTVSSEQTNTTSSDTESSETESSTSAEQVIEDGIVELDQSELIIPIANEYSIETSGDDYTYVSAIAATETVEPQSVELVTTTIAPVDTASYRSAAKRKTQHATRNVDVKRVRVRSESRDIGSHVQSHPHPRTQSMSSSSSLHAQVAAEFIRKVRSTSESKDESTNSASEAENLEPEDEDISDNHRQFVFNLKQSPSQVGARVEKVRVERLSRQISPVIKEEEVIEEQCIDNCHTIEDGVTYSNESTAGVEYYEENSGYYNDEHNTARALLSLTCAKLQRDVSGMKPVMEPAGLTTAGMS